MGDHRKDVKAVGAGIFGERGIRDGGEGRQHVGETDRLMAERSGFCFAGPADDEWHAVSAFPGVGFHSAEAAGGVVAEAFDIFFIPNRAVIGGENDQRIFRHPVVVESF